MHSDEQLIISVEFQESVDFWDRISSSLDLILKDSFSKWLLEDETTWRRVSKEK